MVLSDDNLEVIDRFESKNYVTAISGSKEKFVIGHKSGEVIKV